MTVATISAGTAYYREHLRSAAYYREHLRSCCVLNWVRVAQFLVSCLGLCRQISMFVLSLFDIAASVFRLAAYEYPMVSHCYIPIRHIG